MSTIQPDFPSPDVVFPKYEICKNCTSLKYRVFSEIVANRRPQIKTIAESAGFSLY